MREVISVHVGQAGLQIGNACCEYELPLLVSAYLSSRFHRRFDASSYCLSSHFRQFVGGTMLIRLLQGSCTPLSTSQRELPFICTTKICIFDLYCSLMVVSATAPSLTMMASALSSPRRPRASMCRALYTWIWSPMSLTRSRTGTYRSLFHPETLINGKEDAASNCELICWHICAVSMTDNA